MPHDPLAPTASRDDDRLIADLQALYTAPHIPDDLQRNGATEIRARLTQPEASAPSRAWRIMAMRGEPLSRASAFVAVAAVALICVLAVALFRPGFAGFAGFPGAAGQGGTPTSAQATQTAQAFLGIPPVTLSDVAMVSADDGWAFGTSLKNGCLVLHYDGQSWKRSLGSACASVTSISMLSADDGWALATTPDDSDEILHFTNGSWQVQTIFPAPNAMTPQTGQAQQVYNLRSIAMVSPSEGWAVGESAYLNSNQGSTALILHYASGHWTPAPIAGMSGLSFDMLMGVSMVSATEGWAVGQYDNLATSGYTSYMLLLHYHNGTWSRIDWTHVGALNGVDALPTGDLWAVGTVNMGQTSAVVHLRNGAFVGLLSPVAGSLNAVQIFSTPAGWNGWVVGDGAATVHDANSVWKREGYTIHGYTITSLSLTSPTEGWATGMLMGGGTGEYLIPNWNATLFHLHNGKWSVYPATGF